PFTFTYYGNNYTSLKVVTNGWMGFDVASTSNAYLNAAIPTSAEPNNALYPFWDDLDLRTAGNVYYQNDAANNRFIVEYKNVPHYSTGELYTFQVMLYSDGRIFYQYLDMTASLVNSCTIGTENAAGSTGLQVVYNAAYLHNNLAIKIEKGLAWLDENPSSGTVTPGGSQNVEVIFNSTGLATGTYTGVMNVNSNDPIRPVKSIPVKLIVGTVGIQNTTFGIPTEFSLNQNYPNPFNPTTNLEFGIPELGFVSLKIYDMLGKEVKTLINETKPAGRYRISFDGSDLASGVYYYKIQAGDFVETKRMLLLK
ncbi:MAG: T9SS type A sorting domain-containing protein, partial [Ignavibacteriae bacterium]|nr:T9SS type A sorting domain-containing protein [Ignavibacteriota bacterium]